MCFLWINFTLNEDVRQSLACLITVLTQKCCSNKVWIQWMKVSQLQNLNAEVDDTTPMEWRTVNTPLQYLHYLSHHNIPTAFFFWLLKFLRVDQSLATSRKSEIIKEYRCHSCRKKWRTMARKIEANEFIRAKIVMEKDIQLGKCNTYRLLRFDALYALQTS